MILSQDDFHRMATVDAYTHGRLRCVAGPVDVDGVRVASAVLAP